MGGNIWVESSPGQGSTFHFVVNLARASGPPSSALISLQGSDLVDVPVLLVDDNRTSQQIFKKVLTDWGMKPTIASSGEEAFGIIDSEEQPRFALILLDYDMPGMDGIKVARRIKSWLEPGAAIVLMLSSGAIPDEARDARSAGIAECLFKPFRQTELLAAILKVLKKTKPPKADELMSERAGAQAFGPSLRILLAEDNPVNQTLAMRLLNKRGHTVVLAQNGREAVDAIETQTFDIALLDVQMPLMDGLEVAQSIREHERSMGKSSLPLIALTAHAMNGDRERCLAAGMDAYVSKPINPQQLFQRDQRSHERSTGYRRELAAILIERRAGTCVLLFLTRRSRHQLRPTPCQMGSVLSQCRP